MFYSITRKNWQPETYGLLSQTLSLLDELIKDAMALWTNDNLTQDNPLQSQTLVSKTHRFKRKLELLSRTGLNIDCTTEIKRLRRAITLDAEQASTISLGIKALKIDDINHFATELTNNVYSAFQKKYPRS